MIEHSADDAASGDPERGLDGVFAAVAHERRRTVLDALRATGGDAADLDALVEAVCDDADGPSPAVDEDRRRVRAALRHIHLPKLAAAGLVTYDNETEQVRSREGAVERRLRAATEAYAAAAAGE
ncbi:DUF7344 domain-containing protein [Halorubrum xinjiangense]|uniref:DUF7344 domain-containing protein n=1 Tax=Halorubrum xinjiangense TaxID=261291 RepID=UPI00122DC38B|nr:hypothetical protein [Halorubrum xinjiangense]